MFGEDSQECVYCVIATNPFPRTLLDFHCHHLFDSFIEIVLAE